MRQPRQPDFVASLQQQSAIIARSQLYLAGTLSNRVAQSEFVSVQAQDAAAEAQSAAASALAAASNALSAASSAAAAADAAYAQAAAATDAANAAQSAANNANAVAAALALTHVWRAPGSTNSPTVPGTFAVMPEMSVGGGFGPSPLIVMFSGEFATAGGSNSVRLRVAINGATQPDSERTLGLTNNATANIMYPIAAGVSPSSIEIFWQGSNVYNVGNRRQMSILRIGTA